MFTQKKMIQAGIVSGALLLLAGGAYWWTTWRFIENTDNASIKGDITPISAKLQEYAKEVPVEENNLVKMGDLLVKLDQDQMKLQVRNAETNVDVRKAALKTVIEQRTSQLLSIQQIEAQLKASESDKKLATKNFGRASELAERKFVSTQNLDIAQNTKTKAEEAYLALSASLKTAQQQIPVIDANIQQAKALVEQAEVALKIAQDNLADTVITAPMAGYIVKKTVEPGQYVRPGSVLMFIVPKDGNWVEANYKETQIARMKVGQKASIKVDSHPDKKVIGVIESLSPSTGSQFSLLPPENASGNFTKVVQKIPVRIRLKPEDAHFFKPGQNVSVTINTKE